MKGVITALALATMLVGQVPSQETGRSLLAAGRKRAQEARGLKGAERDAILEDSLRILRMVPERFPADIPSGARAWLEMGRLQRRLGRPEQAEKSFRRVLDHPEEQRTACDALHDLSSLYRRARKRKEAKAALGEIVANFPAQGSSRARALIRLAGLHRDAKEYERSAQLLRQCLKEHGDLWRPSVDALDALVRLKIREKKTEEARRLLRVHEEALRARFAGTPQEQRVEKALRNMPCRGRLERPRAGRSSGS